MYLKEIYLNSEENGVAKTGAIARSLGVSSPSVTEMLGRLQENGLVAYEKHEGARLTRTGEIHARSLLQKHCRIERFLIECLGVTTGFHTEACRLEHAMSTKIADRLDRLIEVEPSCPNCYDSINHYCSRLDVQPEDPSGADRFR